MKSELAPKFSKSNLFIMMFRQISRNADINLDHKIRKMRKIPTYIRDERLPNAALGTGEPSLKVMINVSIDTIFT